MTPLDEHDQGAKNGWQDAMIKVLREEFAETNKKVDKLIIDVAKLQVKAGLTGLIGGTIPAIAAILFLLLKG